MLTELTSTMTEQTLGIEQISLAVHDIDRITQANAAGSEEHAATADFAGRYACADNFAAINALPI